ncbi:hypothetical protein PR048_022043 [Dryococelus australis]|uniref:Uncharacterized protein n=1 Tax=Dryococelus australis TaxID=614101 RepID=A0ABQ9GZX2_9NEOP|nr:hypothetical protein PR048_022043 [Dryococelus australis]
MEDECFRKPEIGSILTFSLHANFPPRQIGFNPRVAPGFSFVGIVPGDVAGWRVFSQISRFPPALHSDAAPFLPRFTLDGCQDLDVKSCPYLSPIHSVQTQYRQQEVRGHRDAWLPTLESPVHELIGCGITSITLNRRSGKLKQSFRPRPLYFPHATSKARTYAESEEGAGTERKGTENGNLPRKPADQRQCPPRFLHAKVPVIPPGIELISPRWKASSLATASPKAPACLFSPLANQSSAHCRSVCCSSLLTVDYRLDCVDNRLAKAAAKLVNAPAAAQTKPTRPAFSATADGVCSSGQYRMSYGLPEGLLHPVQKYGPQLISKVLTLSLTAFTRGLLPPLVILRLPRRAQGATVAERLACSPPTKAIRIQSPAGPLRIFACGNRPGRCRWSAGFRGDLPFPPPLHSGAAPYSPQSPSSALNTSMSRAAKRRIDVQHMYTEVSFAIDTPWITLSESDLQGNK